MWSREVVCVLVAALLVGESAGQGGYQVVRQSCPDMCQRYYGANQNPYYEQINERWSSCVTGCHYYSAHEERLGNDPINVLSQCNPSCEENYYGEISKSCQAGCSFSYEAAGAANQEFMELQEMHEMHAAPRTSRMEEISLPAETESPVVAQEQPLPPFVQLLNKVMPRLHSIMQQTFAQQQYDDENIQQVHQQPQQREMIQVDSEFGRPVFRSFVIPLSKPEGLFGRKQSEDPSPVFSQLFETANNIMQSIPEIPRISMDNPWAGLPGFMRPEGGAEAQGELIISRSGPGYSETKHYNLENGQLIEIDEESRIDNDGLAHANPMDTDFDESDVEMIHPFTQHDSDVEMIEPFIQHHQQVVPAVEAEEHFANEPVFDPFSIPENQYVEDPYNMLMPEHQDINNNEIIEESPEFPAVVEKEETSPEVERTDSDKVETAEVLREEAQPLREIVLELDSNDVRSLRERLMSLIHWNREQQPYLSATKSDYRDISCNSESLPLKDWLACAHLSVGVPRWLTAATIALGIIFSVWLCLVIPSAAPKQKIKSLVIKTQKLSKPSDAVGRELTAAEAKEIEAAAASSREPVIAVIKVDLPPSYRDVTPESPAPSYKSNMTPGSPAPSYKSIDTPLRTPEKKLEPVHGDESVA